jgi:3-hydroxyisobutyrate dehydrogenase
MQTPQPERIGFVGLGTMGAPMAHNLADAGFGLVVRDSAPAAQERFVRDHPASTGAESAADFAGVGIVVTMLPDGGVVRDVLLGWDGGIGAVLAPGAVVVDMSSSDPTDTLELARALGERDVHVVDAPVSGGLPRATTGTLSIMAGGADEDVDLVAKALHAMGDPDRLFRTGGLGSGHAMKALNNYVAAATYCATAEALVVGQRFGLDAGTMIDILNASTGRSFVSEVVFGAEAVTGRYATGFQLGLLAKDVRIAANMSRSVGTETPVAELADRLWAQAMEVIGPRADHSTAHKAWSDTDIRRGV